MSVLHIGRPAFELSSRLWNRRIVRCRKVVG